jgi:hypothetical protein
LERNHQEQKHPAPDYQFLGAHYQDLRLTTPHFTGELGKQGSPNEARF